MSRSLAAQLRGAGIRDERVLGAVARLDRSRFVPERWRAEADADHPLPIGCGQTISQPWLVAWMTERLGLQGDEKVLEVGTGSGYQAALLALLADEVYSVEIVPELAASASRLLLDELGLTNLHLACGDGALGWPEEAPFDRIVVTAAAPAVPPALVAQLDVGGRMILPIGWPDAPQWLRLVELGHDGELRERDLVQVRFVPLTRGAAPG